MTDSDLRTAASRRGVRHGDVLGLADKRAQLMAGARGRVLEVGAGAGRGLRHPRGVGPTWPLDPDLPEAGFDTIVATLVLCRVDDPLSFAQRLRTLLASGGRLLFLEHVQATGAAGVAQRLAAPLWRRVSPGCHLGRNTLHTLREAGFVITDCSRSPGPLVWGRAMPRLDVVGRSRVDAGADR